TTSSGCFRLGAACGRRVHDDAVALAMEGHGAVQVVGAVEPEELPVEIKQLSLSVVFDDQLSSSVLPESDDDGLTFVDTVSVHLALEVAVDAESSALEADELC